MNWKNLKKNMCPSCGKDWMGSYGQNVQITGGLMRHICGFEISEGKFKRTVSSMVEEDIERIHEPEEN
jgi:hypothetical protein